MSRFDGSSPAPAAARSQCRAVAVPPPASLSWVHASPEGLMLSKSFPNDQETFRSQFKKQQYRKKSVEVTDDSTNRMHSSCRQLSSGPG